MKNNIKKSISLLAIIFIFFPSFVLLDAQTPDPNAPREYNLLVPLPGTTDCLTQPGTGECPTTLQRYLPAAFNLTVGIAVALAFIYITIGGVMYATSDAISGKSQGREYIENALWGLLLVIGSYVILWTINPQIVDLNIAIGRAPQQTQTPVVVAANCTGCVTMSSDIVTRHGNQVSSTMLPALNALDTLLDANSISWVVTEAFPPTVAHACACHRLGTCIDAYPISRTPGSLNTFATYAQQVGLRPVYEVATDGERQRLQRGDPASGIPPYTGPIQVVEGINGPHFSVYSTTCNP